MSKEKYAPSGLPSIPRERIEVYFRDFDKRISEGYTSFERFVKETGSKIIEDNPEVNHFFNEINKRKGESNKQFMDGFVIGLLITYELLRSQLEIISLEE